LAVAGRARRGVPRLLDCAALGIGPARRVSLPGAMPSYSQTTGLGHRPKTRLVAPIRNDFQTCNELLDVSSLRQANSKLTAHVQEESFLLCRQRALGQGMGQSLRLVRRLRGHQDAVELRPGEDKPVVIRDLGLPISIATYL